MPVLARQSEISFLQHRLEVIEFWPDSPRKAATRTAILQRLDMLGVDRVTLETPGTADGRFAVSAALS